MRILKKEDFTYIQITKSVAEALRKRKIYARETYDSILRRMMLMEAKD
jgi:hypothetical protein